MGISFLSLLASLTLFSYFYCSVLVGECYESLRHAEPILLICFSRVPAVRFSFPSLIFTTYDVPLLHSLRPLCQLKMRTSAVIIAATFIAASPALAAPVRSGPGNGAYVNRSTTVPRDLSEGTLLLRESPDLEARLYEYVILWHIHLRLLTE